MSPDRPPALGPAPPKPSDIPPIAVLAIGIVGLLVSSGAAPLGREGPLARWFSVPFGADGAPAVRELAGGIFGLVAGVGLAWLIVRHRMALQRTALQRDVRTVLPPRKTMFGGVILCLVLFGGTLAVWSGGDAQPRGGWIYERWGMERVHQASVAILAGLTLLCALYLWRQVRRDRRARTEPGGRDDGISRPR